MSGRFTINDVKKMLTEYVVKKSESDISTVTGNRNIQKLFEELDDKMLELEAQFKQISSLKPGKGNQGELDAVIVFEFNAKSIG